MTDAIPLSIPHLGGNEWVYVKECLDAGDVAAAGTFIGRFERAVAGFVGAKHAVATASGTAALHLALAAVGVGPGDEVIVPDFTFAAPVNAVLYCGGVPVLLDVDRSTGTLVPERVREYLEGGAASRVKAILPVHLYGHPADMDPIWELGRRHGIPVVEDAAECLGASYRGTRIGARGDIACFSFNGNKVITTGGGGMVVSAREDWIRRCRHLGSQAKAHPTEYVHDAVGFNYRLPNLNAAVGLAQMERLESHLERKRRIAALYAAGLAGVPGLSLLAEQPWARSSFWLSTVLVEAEAFGRTARELADALRGSGIDCRRVWPPLHDQAPYRAFARSSTSGATWLFERGVNIPSSVGLDDAQVARVIETIRGLAKR